MLQAVSHTGMKQTVHVLIATYTEPAVTVRECVLRCIVAPEPIYMEKMIYVCDDGHSKSEGPKKRAMVEELRILGMYLLTVVSACGTHLTSCRNVLFPLLSVPPLGSAVQHSTPASCTMPRTVRL